MAELKHGSLHAYSNLKCRCDVCRKAWRIYQRARLGRRAEPRFANEARS